MSSINLPVSVNMMDAAEDRFRVRWTSTSVTGSMFNALMVAVRGEPVEGDHGNYNRY